MSEPVIAAVEAAAGPLLQEAEKALAPEAAIALTDLHNFVTGEMDALRTQLPTLVGLGVEHLHNLGAELLNRYHAVIARVEAHLSGLTPEPMPEPAVPAAVPAPVMANPPAPVTPVEAVPTPVAAPIETPAPAAPVAVDPTVPPTSAPSAPPATDSSTTSAAPNTVSPTPSVADAPAATA